MFELRKIEFFGKGLASLNRAMLLIENRTDKTNEVRTMHQQAIAFDGPACVSGSEVCPSRDVKSTPVLAQSTLFYLLAPAMIACGHGIAALGFFFSVEPNVVEGLLKKFGFERGTEKKRRNSVSPSAWTATEIQDLMRLWQTNLFASAIALELGTGRSAASVRYKAKWLGLPKRERKGMVRVLAQKPDFTTPLVPKLKRGRQFYGFHTDHTDGVIGHGSLSGASMKSVAHHLGLPLRSVETRKSYLMLPNRSFLRGKLSMTYDPNAPFLDVFREQGWAMRKCLASDMPRNLWSPKNGPRISNATKKTKAYKNKVGGMDESGSGFDGDD